MAKKVLSQAERKQPTPGKRRKRRKRRRTAGVRLLRAQPGSRQSARIAYDDPRNPGKEKRETIPIEWRESEDLQIKFCEKRARELNEERRRIALGLALPEKVTVRAAIEEWLDTYPDQNTRTTYAEGTGRFERWMTANGVSTLDVVIGRHLVKFRNSLPSEEVANTTRNKWLRSVGTFLQWGIAMDYCPHLAEDYKTALKKFREPKSPPKPLQHTVVRKAFEAVERHDADVFRMTRHEKVGGRRRQRGATPKYDPMMPMLMVTTLLGTRRSEGVRLDWSHFKPDAVDESGNVVGAMVVPAEVSKTKTERMIFLDYSPGLRDYLIRLKLATGGKGSIVSISYDQAAKALPRLRSVYGAPIEFSWQAMRVTGSSYLTSSPAIFGSASHSQSAARLGHSWKTAERYYAKSLVGIARDATTLEAALGIEDLVKRACQSASRTEAFADTGQSTFSLSG